MKAVERRRPNRGAGSSSRMDLTGRVCSCCAEGCPEKLWGPSLSLMGEMLCANCFTAIWRNGWCPDEEGYCGARSGGA
jgi:hypothetical protein